MRKAWGWENGMNWGAAVRRGWSTGRRNLCWILGWIQHVVQAGVTWGEKRSRLALGKVPGKHAGRTYTLGKSGPAREDMMMSLKTGTRWKRMKYCHLQQHGWTYDYHTEWHKPGTERQILHDITYIQNLKTNTNELITKQKHTHWKMILWLPKGERDGGGEG